MSFFHAPTVVSLAIGAWLTLLDLLVWQSREVSNQLELFDTIPLRSGQSCLRALEAMGLVEVRRYEDGSVERVILRASHSTVLYALLDLGRQSIGSLPAPLSTTRLKLAVPLFYGDHPFVPSRN